MIHLRPLLVRGTTGRVMGVRRTEIYLLPLWRTEIHDSSPPAAGKGYYGPRNGRTADGDLSAAADAADVRRGCGLFNLRVRPSPSENRADLSLRPGPASVHRAGCGHITLTKPRSVEETESLETYFRSQFRKAFWFPWFILCYTNSLQIRLYQAGAAQPAPIGSSKAQHFSWQARACMTMSCGVRIRGSRIAAALSQAGARCGERGRFFSERFPAHGA
jgi:hypothetical protein